MFSVCREARDVLDSPETRSSLDRKILVDVAIFDSFDLKKNADEFLESRVEIGKLATTSHFADTATVSFRTISSIDTELTHFTPSVMSLTSSSRFSFLRGPPSISEFTAFHSMVCNPLSAQRCIEYLDGAALFASQDDYQTTEAVSTFDYLQTPLRMNWFTYYGLVIFSGTGLLTLLRQTETKLVQEENVTFGELDHEGKTAAVSNRKVESKSLDKISGRNSLVISSEVIDYLIQQSRRMGPKSTTSSADKALCQPGEIRLIRRFEFQFGSLVSVMMCHFECCHQRRYLVEVYQFSEGRDWMTRLIVWSLKNTKKFADDLQQLAARAINSLSGNLK